ncbi:exported hypothetical protein [Candidatus Zixiibacteriota bacterium]|nr:exported hypothetical protein [candidate division Zixibacteria bacterium]
MGKYLKALSFALTTLVIIALPQLPDAQVYFPFTGHYYEKVLIPPNMTWQQCRDSAISLGGYLATATSKTENDFIASLAYPFDTFLGGTDEDSEGNWHWISIEPWQFTAWRAGEPNNHWEDEDYVGLSPLDSLWNDMRNWFIDAQAMIVEYNDRTGIFVGPINYGVGSWPWSICAADFDNDSDIDLAVANWESNSVTILKNDGSGIFPNITSFGSGAAPWCVAFGDLDEDGDEDLAVANYTLSAITILENNSYGIFTIGATYSVGLNPISIAVADFNNDNHSDLAVANEGSNSISVLFNSGNGDLLPRVDYGVDSLPISICASDLDNDGDLDLITADVGTNNITVLYNDGLGNFSDRVEFGAHSGPWSVKSHDINGDNYKDLIVANVYSSDISILINNGTGQFHSIQNYPVLEGGAYSVEVADFNNDCAPDIVVANGDANSISFLENNGTGAFSLIESYPADNAPVSIISADFNSDGIMDCAVANAHSGSASVYFSRKSYGHDFNVSVLGESSDHVMGTTPIFNWAKIGENHCAQDTFFLQVGADTDWAYAEMWNPEPVASSDTFVTYAGAPLIDGQTYYMRLRVHNGTVWSNWYDTSFHMNSLPSIPEPSSPINSMVVNTLTPTLYLHNSTDAEDDTLTYDFRIDHHSMFGPPSPIEDSNIAQGADSTGWTVSAPLTENWRYLWQGRAFDQYEKSGWSATGEFYVNAVEEAPWGFGLIMPPDTAGSIVFDMLPRFYWGLSTDPDPFDTVRYTLYLAVDSNFQYVKVIDSIAPSENQYIATDSLFFGTQYWWKVKAADRTGLYTYSSDVKSFRTWKLGDANGNWAVNILDVAYIINFLYNEGPSPVPKYAADINGNCAVNILDVSYLINYLYKSGPAPKIGCE